MTYDERTTLPVPGVTVFVSGTNKGAQTNERGEFTLKNVDDGDAVVFTSIGYEKLTLRAGGIGGHGLVKMKMATSELDQAVVQAYGITSKRLATGNITKVTAREIEEQPVMNPLLALQGRVPGLLVTQTNGYSSSPVKMEIRGRNSLGTNFTTDPLYIIDGVPLTVLNVGNTYSQVPGVSTGLIQSGFSATNGQSPLFGMNPKDIESIEVLKDADATAIYGSRGANGVIIITTKRGKAGKTAFSLDVKQGVVFVPKRWKLMNTSQYLQMRREAFRNDGAIPTPTTAPDLTLWDSTRYTDWQKQMLGTGYQTSVSASLTGGDEQTNFYVGTNYTRQQEMLKKSGSSQVAALNANVRHSSKDHKFSIMLGSEVNYTSVDAVGGISRAYTLAPNAPPIFDSKGNLNYAEWDKEQAGETFPFAALLQPTSSQINQFKSNLEVRYEIVKGLTFTTTGGYQFSSGSNKVTMPMASQNPAASPMGMAFFGTTKNSNWIVEPQLAYSRLIGKGDLSVQAGGSLQSVTTDGITQAGLGYGDDNLMGTIANAPIQSVTEGYSRYKYAAVFGRINYNWANKYIINLNARRDGSSRFGPGHQFGNFGSVGAAWILSEEKWMRQLMPAWMSFAKLRGSYGLTGSDGAIGDYQYLSQWSASSGGFPIPRYDGVQPFIPIHAVNPDYHWENNKKIEGSLALGFLNDKINLEAAYYKHRSGDQVTNYPTPLYTGFPSVVANWAAVVQNSGWEGSIRANLISRKDLSWSVFVNISTNKNILVSYPNIEKSPFYNIYQVGYSLSTKYKLHYLGVNPLTGQYAYEDHNKDGIVNLADGFLNADNYRAIDMNPKYYGGAGSQFSYKGFRLDFFFDYKRQLGVDPFMTATPGLMMNLPVKALENHWQKPGDNARYARFSALTGASATALNNSDGPIVDASYFRLNNLSISYDLPGAWVKRAHMESCRFFIQTQNLFTITKYPGLDPEVQDLNSPPSSRTVTGGFSFNF